MGVYLSRTGNEGERNDRPPPRSGFFEHLRFIGFSRRPSGERCRFFLGASCLARGSAARVWSDARVERRAHGASRAWSGASGAARVWSGARVERRVSGAWRASGAWRVEERGAQWSVARTGEWRVEERVAQWSVARAGAWRAWSGARSTLKGPCKGPGPLKGPIRPVRPSVNPSSPYVPSVRPDRPSRPSVLSVRPLRGPYLRGPLRAPERGRSVSFLVIFSTF